MVFTPHGHHIPGTVLEDNNPRYRARCGGVLRCSDCKSYALSYIEPNEDPYILDLVEKLEYNFTYEEVEEILNRRGKFQIPLQWVVLFGTHNFRNTAHDLKLWFCTHNRPVTDEEFIKFWQSLTIRERLEFKDAEL